MIAVNELRGKIVAKGLTQGEVAKQLGITPKTFREKLKRGVLNSDEMEKLIVILDIKDPVNIFFRNKVT